MQDNLDDMPIYVTKPFLPPREEYDKYLDSIWQSNQLTNNGPLHKEFKTTIESYLGVDDFQFLTNGTLALQLAIRALDIEPGSEIITTPFTYVATTSAILWEKCTPVYVDIKEEDYCIDPAKIEEKITEKTKAILAVHVFGNPCAVEEIQAIAEKHNLKVIYDAAHAFGVEYKNESLLKHGDITMCSFHATKPFHTIEGGGLVAKDKDVQIKIDYLKKFGHQGDDHVMLGINAKASEFQAAMGLVNLKHLDEIIRARKKVFEEYSRLIDEKITKARVSNNVTKHNYSYYPVVFETEDQLLKAMKKLEGNSIFPRRYFYPSLNKLPYLQDKNECRISDSFSKRILCLPLYHDISDENISLISTILMGAIEEDD